MRRQNTAKTRRAGTAALCRGGGTFRPARTDTCGVPARRYRGSLSRWRDAAPSPISPSLFTGARLARARESSHGPCAEFRADNAPSARNYSGVSARNSSGVSARNSSGVSARVVLPRRARAHSHAAGTRRHKDTPGDGVIRVNDPSQRSESTFRVSDPSQRCESSRGAGRRGTRVMGARRRDCAAIRVGTEGPSRCAADRAADNPPGAGRWRERDDNHDKSFFDELRLIIID